MAKSKEHPKTEWFRSLKFGDMVLLADKHDICPHMVIKIYWKKHVLWVRDNANRCQFFSKNELHKCPEQLSGTYLRQEVPYQAELCPVRGTVLWHSYAPVSQVELWIPNKVTIQTNLFDRLLPLNLEFLTLAELDNLNLLREQFHLTPLTR